MKQVEDKLVFGRRNYILLILGLVMILGGFVIMSLETQPYGFGIMGLSVGPFLSLAGFVLEAFAIFSKKEGSSKIYTKSEKQGHLKNG